MASLPTFLDARQLRHDPPSELHNGSLVSYAATPARACAVARNGLAGCAVDLRRIRIRYHCRPLGATLIWRTKPTHLMLIDQVNKIR